MGRRFRDLIARRKRAALLVTFLLPALLAGALMSPNAHPQTVGPGCDGASNCYVRAGATGNNSGSDWTNAFTQLYFATNAGQASHVARGVTIFVASGHYTCGPANTVTACNFDVPNSGSTLITVQAATVSNHGPAAGWQNSFGVDVSGPAVWQKNTQFNTLGAIWVFHSDNWIADCGSRPNPFTFAQNSYGCKIDNTWPNSVGGGIALDDHANIAIHGLEYKGQGVDINFGEQNTVGSVASVDPSHADMVVTIPPPGPSGTQWHFPYVGKVIVVSGVGVPCFNTPTFGTITSVISATEFVYTFPGMNCSGSTSGSGSIHGPAVFEVAVTFVDTQGTANTKNDTIDFSYVHDVDGVPFLLRNTANITLDHIAVVSNSNNATNHAEGFSEAGAIGFNITDDLWVDIEGTAVWAHTNGGFSSNWNIFGNLIYLTSTGHRTGASALLFCGGGPSGGGTCSNFSVLNNTTANFKTPHLQCDVNTTCTGIVCEDNLWFSFSGPLSINVCNTHDFNTFINVNSVSQPLSANEFSFSTAADPFISQSTGNYKLRSDTIVPHLNDGVTLTSPPGVLTDLLGRTRGQGGVWDRGAFQFVRPNPPQNLRTP